MVPIKHQTRIAARAFCARDPGSTVVRTFPRQHRAGGARVDGREPTGASRYRYIRGRAFGCMGESFARGSIWRGRAKDLRPWVRRPANRRLRHMCRHGARQRAGGSNTVLLAGPSIRIIPVFDGRRRVRHAELRPRRFSISRSAHLLILIALRERPASACSQRRGTHSASGNNCNLPDACVTFE